MFAGLLSGVSTLPGMTRDDERYFRDLYDHLIRISDLVDSYRDLLMLGTASTGLEARLVCRANVKAGSPRSRVGRAGHHRAESVVDG
jgi:hypothetical protein